MNEDCLKLTTYLGERARVDGRFIADAFTDVFAAHRLRASVLLRGVEGFGAKHGLRSDRLLTLSEDLPLVSVAVDARPRIEGALEDLAGLRFSGLVTLERAQMLTAPVEPIAVTAQLREAAKLTVYLGRHERVAATPAYESVVGLLHDRGVEGATVLLGVDGTSHGQRRRAAFFERNAEVPLMVIAIGDGERIAAVAPEVGAMLARPLMTLERVRICKRDGRLLAEPQHVPERDESGRGIWQKLMIYAGEQSRSGSRPLSHEIVRALRRAGAAGATSLRGIWGYHGDHRPHGDSFTRLRRRVPIVTVVVDTPRRIRGWFAIVDDLTRDTGLVTSETVPAYRATAERFEGARLHLARQVDE